jgi:hypothetical protein
VAIMKAACRTANQLTLGDPLGRVSRSHAPYNRTFLKHADGAVIALWQFCQVVTPAETGRSVHDLARNCCDPADSIDVNCSECPFVES